MKVRWTDDSLRLRITPTELDAVVAGQAVSTAITFPAAPQAAAPLRWRVALRVDRDLPAARLLAEADTVLILLSPADAAQLAEPDREGIYFSDHTADGPARFFVEKDFPCIHPRAAEALETPTETFSAPADFAQRKA